MHIKLISIWFTDPDTSILVQVCAQCTRLDTRKVDLSVSIQQLSSIKQAHLQYCAVSLYAIFIIIVVLNVLRHVVYYFFVHQKLPVVARVESIKYPVTASD